MSVVNRLQPTETKWYAWRGSNARPSVPETDALVQLSYRRIQWI
jgi:hypothetical protein